MPTLISLEQSELRNAALVTGGTTRPDHDSLKVSVIEDEGKGHDLVTNSTSSFNDLFTPD